MKSVLMAYAALGFLGLAGPAAAQNIVTNPSFEDPFLTGWNAPGFGLGHDPGRAQSGSSEVLTGCSGHGCVDTFNFGAFFEQTLVTNPGQLYDLSFWVGQEAGTGEFSVFWNGALIADVLNPAPNAFTGSGMTQFSYTGLLASGSSTNLQIHGRQDTNAIFFDDISVVAAANLAAVPEPGTWALMLMGFGGIGFAVGRRTKGTGTRLAGAA